MAAVDSKHPPVDSSGGGGENPRQRFLEDQCALHTRSKASLRASLHLDLMGTMMTTSAASLTPDEEKEEIISSSAASPSIRKLKPSQVGGKSIRGHSPARYWTSSLHPALAALIVLEASLEATVRNQK